MSLRLLILILCSLLGFAVKAQQYRFADIELTAKTKKTPFEVAEVQVDSITGRITITGKVDPKTGIAPKVTLPKGRDYVITDSQGKVYQLDESGKVTTKGTREQGTQLAQQAGKGDSKNPPISNKHFKVEWLFNDELANDTNGEIPYKALVKGKTSSFELRIQPADTTQYDFFFHTENGVKVEAESKGEGLYKITRKGAFDFAQEEVWVVAKEKKDKKGKKEELIGKCILVHLSPKEVNVALVPTQSGQNLQEAIAQVQQIYEKVGVTLHITTEKPFDISDQLKNGTLPTENEFGDLSTYSPEQNAVIAKFTTNRKPKDNTYYIFLVNDGTGDHGYMRLGGQYGFVYSANARTIAHELGHGIFKLEHPFKGKNADKGKTSALMDYNEGQDFFYRDWKQINDPKVKLYAFQGQGEGEYLVYSLQQILDFLRSNKNKEVNFPPAKQDYNLEKYSSKTRLDEYFTNKENKKVKIVGLYCNDKKGKLNLSTVGNIVGRTGYSVEFNEYNAVFSMYVYYAQGKEPAITIKTKGYHALKEILNYVGFEITGESKRHIAKLYKEAFGKAGYDYNKIDALLEDIPSFIVSEFSDETLWKYLQSLSKGSIDTAGTNEESAIFNVINSFKDDKYLYNQLYNHQEVVYDLYSGIDGDNVIRYLNKLLQLTNKYSKAEEQSLKHFCFLGYDNSSHNKFLTDIKNIEEVNKLKHIKSWLYSSKGVLGKQDVVTLSNFSKNNLLDAVDVYLYKNKKEEKEETLPIIYIYHLSKKQNQEDLLKTIEIASNFLGLYGASRGLFVKGASVVLKTAATIEIVNLSLNAYMQNESHRKEIENMGAGGKWFVENWSTISILTDLATFSVAILDDLPKVSAKLQKEGVDTKELDTFVEKARKEVRKTITKGDKKILGKIVRNGNKIEYTNPAGKILRWSEQRAKDIENAIQATKKLNNTNVNNIGKITEGKVGEFVKSRKEVLGFGQKIEPNITDIDVSTLDEIIEVKTSFSAVKENQFDKFLNSKLDNFCNPEQKKVILYIDKPMSEATNTQLNMINRIKQKNVIVVNSLDELEKIIK